LAYAILTTVLWDLGRLHRGAGESRPAYL